MQLLLLLHDLGISPEVTEVHAGFDSERGKISVEVVRRGAHHRLDIAHRRKRSVAIAHIQLQVAESRTEVFFEKRRRLSDPDISQRYMLNVGILQKVIGTCRALQTRTEH
jgi:hypothetical protein